MGCPAKKVCKAWAGSALMRDEALVARILDAVVRAVDVPVTLKIRTGWSADQRNALTIAGIAEQAGITALAVHGRTRDQLYTGQAEYDTIAEVKASVRIPVLANGDIDGPEAAVRVLRHTGADGLMIGRAAQGRPWIFREIAHFLQTGEHLPEPAPDQVCDLLIDHLNHLHDFYGELAGVRIARKHLGWYAKGSAGRSDSALSAFRVAVNGTDCPRQQIELTQSYFQALSEGAAERWAAAA
jgi:tRNA-dihydrouridine synthase B